MDQVKDLFNEYTNLDTYKNLCTEAFATGLFLYTAQAGGANPVKWGLTYVIFKSVTGAQMLSTLAIRDFAAKGDYDFKAFRVLFNTLLAQALGAFLGHELYNFTEGDALAASGTGFAFLNGNAFNWASILAEFFMVFLFIFFTTKNQNQNIFWTFMAVAAAFWFNGNGIFTPNRVFGAGFNTWDSLAWNDVTTWFGWFNLSWRVYLLTFLAAWVSHFFTAYLF